MWDEKEIVYWLWNGGPPTVGENGVLHIAASVTKEQIPGSVATCPDCLKNLMKE
jgi:hypothetical protein